MRNDITYKYRFMFPQNNLAGQGLKLLWASYQIRKIAGCACAGNAGNVFPGIPGACATRNFTYLVFPRHSRRMRNPQFYVSGKRPMPSAVAGHACTIYYATDWGHVMYALQWRHKGCDCVSNHQSPDCLFNRLFGHKSNENIKAPRHWPSCGEFTVTGEFPTQRAINEENVSTWWRHHVCRSDIWLAAEQAPKPMLICCRLES